MMWTGRIFSRLLPRRVRRAVSAGVERPGEAGFGGAVAAGDDANDAADCPVVGDGELEESEPQAVPATPGRAGWEEVKSRGLTPCRCSEVRGAGTELDRTKLAAVLALNSLWSLRSTRSDENG